MITESSAGFILISDNFDNSDPSVLLLHYNSGHWDFPKGNIENNETEIQAATRELKEETGIESFTLLPGFRHVLNYNLHVQPLIEYKEDDSLINILLFTISSTTSLECPYCPHKIYFSKFWPKNIHKHQFAICALPQEKTTQPFFARSSQDKVWIRLGEVRSIKIGID